MPTRKAKVVTNVEGRSIFRLLGPDAGMTSGGDIDWVCGQCGHLLAKGMNPGQVHNVVFECSECHAFSEVMATPEELQGRMGDQALRSSHGNGTPPPA